MYGYFHKDANDERFFAGYIDGRLPGEIVDAHVHVNLPEHVAAVSPATIAGDWALQCGLVMPYEDAAAYHAALFPGRRVGMLAFPWPLPEADIPANNAYLADLTRSRGIGALMTIRPEWSAEYVEEQLLAGGFSGFKPYPYMAAAEKGAEVSIFDFLPHSHLAVADRHGKAVLLHLPRKGRLASGDNIREIRDIVQGYPGLRLVLAHYGRCFNPKFLREGLDKLGADRRLLYFDTAAVINPDVHREALERLDAGRILFGTDMPILLWHGRRHWTETEYFNLCREDFPWNKHPRPDEEEGYTFFIYEQLRAMLDAMERSGCPARAVRDIFCGNAERVYELKQNIESEGNG